MTTLTTAGIHVHGTPFASLEAGIYIHKHFSPILKLCHEYTGTEGEQARDSALYTSTRERSLQRRHFGALLSMVYQAAQLPALYRAFVL
jgi:hypothetical protein